MKHYLICGTIACGLLAGQVSPAHAVVNGAAARVTLAQDGHEGHDHAQEPEMPRPFPTTTVDESPLTNLAFPILMIVGGLLYMAITNRRPQKQ